MIGRAVAARPARRRRRRRGRARHRRGRSARLAARRRRVVQRADDGATGHSDGRRSSASTRRRAAPSSSTSSARPASTSSSCRSSTARSSSTWSGPRAGSSCACRRSDPVPVDAVPEAWRAARGWILAPVAAELPDGLGRRAVRRRRSSRSAGRGCSASSSPGEAVRHVDPRPESAHRPGRSRRAQPRRRRPGDRARLRSAGSCVAGSTLAVTRGDRGGLRHGAAVRTGRVIRATTRRSAATNPIDPTGAGDVFLAALAAARIEPRLVGGRIDAGFDLLLAAAAASLVLEGPGLLGVPDRAAVMERMAAARREGSGRPV